MPNCFLLASGQFITNNDDNAAFTATPLTPDQHQQLIDICARVSREERLVSATPEQRQQILDEESQRAREEEEAAQAKIEALRKQAELEKRQKEADNRADNETLETITEKTEETFEHQKESGY